MAAITGHLWPALKAVAQELHRRQYQRNPGDYPQNWYNQVLRSTQTILTAFSLIPTTAGFATRTGTSFFDITCGYTADPRPITSSRGPPRPMPCARFFSILLEGSDGGIFGTANADASDPTTSTRQPG